MFSVPGIRVGGISPPNEVAAIPMRINLEDDADAVSSPRLVPLLAPRTRLKLAGSTQQEMAQNFEKFKTLVRESHQKLLTSPSASVRSGYLRVVRRIVSYVRSRFEAERALELAVETINDSCANLVRKQEDDPAILMQMFDLLFEFVASEPVAATGPADVGGNAGKNTSGAVPPSSSVGAGVGPSLSVVHCAEAARDTNYMQFLAGKRRVALKLLARLNVKPFKLLFDKLPLQYEDARVVCLILLAAMCSADKVGEDHAKTSFQEVGQLQWFKVRLMR